MNATTAIKENSTLSFYEKKIERAKKNLASCGITEEALRRGAAAGKTTIETIREITKPQSADGQPEKTFLEEYQNDPMLDAIFDEWLAQAEPIEQLQLKIKRLQAKTKKQKARIAELESRVFE